MAKRIVNAPSGAWSVEDRGEGRVVLLVHGFPLDHSMWRRQIELFSQAFRVIAPDLAGFGESSPVSGFSMASLADDLAAVLDQLEIKKKSASAVFRWAGTLLGNFGRGTRAGSIG